MSCETCKSHQGGEDKGPGPIPKYYYEGIVAKDERTIKRLVWALVIAILVAFASNMAWLYAWAQYDYSGDETVYTYQQDGRGLNIIGDGNEAAYNGTDGDG